MTEVAKLSEEEREDLHALYQACVEDLAFFKSQQWSITNYSFLAYGGIFAAGQVTGLSSWLFKVALIALAISVAYSGVMLLKSLHQAIEVRQARLAFIRNKLTAIFREAWGAMEKGEELFRPVWILGGALILGGGSIALLVGFGPWKT